MASEVAAEEAAESEQVAAEKYKEVEAEVAAESEQVAEQSR